MKPIKLVYILAASHSGSTLLAMLLGSHPEVCTAGELKANFLGNADDYLCSCKRKIKACPFWSCIRSEMNRRGFPLDFTNPQTDVMSVSSQYARWLLKPLHRGYWIESLRDCALFLSPIWRKEEKMVRRKNIELIQCLLDLSGKRMIVDSSKIGLRLKYLQKIDELDIYVLRLIRDGRSVALTYMDPARFADAMDPALRGVGTDSQRLSERLSMKEAAYEWKRSNEEADCILRQFNSNRWMEVRYEELCRSPNIVLAELAKFIGVDAQKISLNFRSNETHVIGNGMRLDDHSDIRFDERWKNQLTAADLNTFDAIAGRLNRRLGYQ